MHFSIQFHTSIPISCGQTNLYDLHTKLQMCVCVCVCVCVCEGEVLIIVDGVGRHDEHTS